MHIIYREISAISLRNLLFVFCFLFNLIFVVANSYSQESETDPITFLSEPINFSKASFRNNLAHDGKVFVFINGENKFIRDYSSLDTFSFDILNYDSIQFYSEFTAANGKTYILDGFFIKVIDNQPFGFEANEIMEMSGAEMIVANNQLKNLSGKKLYEVIIKDDVNPDQIKVEALPEASKYIDILKLDSSTYQIKLKNKTEFYGNLSEDLKEKWTKGEEIKFPVGVSMYDTVVTTDIETIQYTLVKKKKLKKVKK